MAEKSEKQLPVEVRMELFKALVEAQDQELGTVRARQLIAVRYGVGENDVRRIEEEGLQGDWPPLG
jgi:site-specific recombinase XerC